MIITDIAAPAEIHGPSDPALAALWTLALAKFQAASGRPPETRSEWRAVTAEYGRLLSRPHGALSTIIAERCAEVPGGD